jgi:hypothetical protein
MSKVLRAVCTEKPLFKRSRAFLTVDLDLRSVYVEAGTDENTSGSAEIFEIAGKERLSSFVSAAKLPQKTKQNISAKPLGCVMPRYVKDAFFSFAEA